MELSLIPNQKRITFYIERLIYGVVIAMPLQPMVGDVLLWLAIGLALYDLISSKSLSLPTGYLSWTVMIFVIWTGISSLMSPNWDWSIQSWFYQIVAGGGMYYLVRTYIRTPKQWNYFLRAFLGTALLVCIIGAYQYIFVPNIHIKEWVISYILVYMKENRTREVVTMLIIGIVLFLTMLLTYSRGIWISFAAMILYWAIFVERRLFLSLLVVPLILYFYEGEVASRLWSIFQGHDTSSDLRWALWDSTMYIVRENPIFGIGWNTFYLVYPEYNYYIQGPNVLMYHAHNLYLNILAETGIPGLLSFLAVIVGHVITSVRLKGDMFRQAAQIGIGALAIGVLFSGLSDFELYSHQVTIVFWQLLGWVGAFVKVQLSTKKHM
ncbi:MAG: O-antigen ligase family protein [Veillonella parvula]|nr:O-antigen ligase family protein [Veillonella parvula]